MQRAYEFGEFTLVPAKMLLLRGDEPVSISPKALELLVLLVESRERVVTRTEMMERVWEDTFVEEGNINFHISNLRRVLGENEKSSSRFIITVPKKGYKFVGDVRVKNVPGDSDLPAVKPTLGIASPRFRWSMVGIVGVVAIGLVFAAVLGSRGETSSTEVTVAKPPVPTEAVALYTQGKRIWESRVFKEQDPGELFRRAIEIAPEYLEAHLALADTYAFDGTPKRAETALAEARRLGGETADSLATEAFIRMFHYWDWDGAEQRFQRSIELDPRNAKARHWYGVYLSLRGRLADAKAEMRTAGEIDSGSLIIASDLAQLDYFSGDLAAAAEKLEAVLKTEPRFTMARRYLADVRERQGDEAAAFEERMKAYVRPTETVAEMRDTFLSGGLESVRAKDLRSGKCGPQTATPYECAVVFQKSSDRRNAIKMLEIAVQSRSFQVPLAAVDPVFADLRGDPRFRSLIQQTGL